MTMDNLTSSSQSTVLQLQPDNPTVSPVIPSLLHDDMIAILILPYFQVKELIHAEFISQQFRDSIIKFYRSMKTFNYWTNCQAEKWKVEGLINKVCCYLPNIRCLELHSLTSVEPLSKLNLMQKLHTIRLTGEVDTAEFIAFASSLKSMAKNLHILDFGRLNFTPFPDGIPDRDFFDDFIMLNELHVISVFCPYLPNTTLPKLSIFECGPYFSDPVLLDQFCQKNLQIEELITKTKYCGHNSQLFPSSTFAVFRNLRALGASGYSIDGILAKHFVDSCQNVTKLTLDLFYFMSDDVMQIIFDGLSDTLVQLKLENMADIKPTKAIQGIYKLQKLQRLVLRWKILSLDKEDAVPIEELLVLKSLTVLHLEAIPLKFTSNCTTLKFSLLEELQIWPASIEYMKILDFCTDGLKTLNFVNFGLTNMHLLQVCDSFPNLACLNIAINKTTSQDTLNRMILAFPKLRYLKIIFIGAETLLAFIHNCKCLSTIATWRCAADVLRNHPSIKILRNSGRCITIY